MQALLAHCSAAFSQHGSMFAVFFLGGLMGSLTHCLTMCGPVVACQSACGGGCGTRLSRSAQWHYHLGRLLTYGALGYAAALLSRQIAAASYWPRLSAVMMLLAGIVFLTSALMPQPHHWLRASAQNHLLRGVLMSFMPCGLIYAALMMAATLSNPFSGMVAMWLFVLGTLPVLMLASGSAALLARRWQGLMQGVGRAGVAFNGLTLLAMAINTVR